MKKLLSVLCIFICIMAMTACSGNGKSTTDSSWQEEKEGDLDKEKKEESNANGSTLALDDTTREIATKDNLKLKYGVFYDVYDGNKNEDDKNNILILQVLLSEAQDREIVLEQNFLNVEDLIKNQNCSVYDQIEYVAKIKNKDNKKEDVISFLLDKNCINLISTAAITVEEYEQNVKELWVAQLPIEILDENETVSEEVQATDMTNASTENNIATTQDMTSTTSIMNQENNTDISSQIATTSTMVPSTTSTSATSNTIEQNSESENTVPDFIIQEN